MIGQTISHYQIIEKLGEGGMGVVYKAHDTKLDRDVALKFLPSHLNASEQDKARFIQEAKAASALNHPNVCTIHDIQDHNNQLFIVMEFVDGQTLAEKRSSMSFKQAIETGIQIADGLAAAHDKGIVHRDIKPENIMIRKDGIAQIMDFGLAKLRGVSRLTKEGSTVGTAGYMSPEQVQGVDADHRSDIFSFGVVLYELLTKQLPFKGIHETAVAYEIVNVDAPPMSSVNPQIDPTLDAIVLECLEKDPNERTQSVKQISIDLKRFKRESSRQRMSRITAARPVVSSVRGAREAEISEPASTRGSMPARIPWILSGVLLLAVVALAWLQTRERPSPIQAITANIMPPESWSYFNDYDGGHISISPDGLTLAFVAKDSTGKASLWIRPIGSTYGQRLRDTEGATYPFWSPDSRSIGFFAGGKLCKVLAAGGPPVQLCDAPAGRGGTWNQGGIILFSPRFDQTCLYRVSEAGGEPVPATTVDTTRNETNHRWPLFLPDGKHFLFSTQAATRSPDYYGSIYLSTLGKAGTILVAKSSSNIAYANGNIIFVRQGILVAQPVDPGSYTPVGDAIPISENVEYSIDKNKGVFTCSQNGVLIYQAGHTLNIQHTLVWYDRSGKRQSIPGDIAVTYAANLSPDNSRIVYDSYDPQLKTNDVWIHDFSRSINTRLTFERSDEANAVWAPDTKKIIFESDRTGRNSLYWKNSDGTESDQPLPSTGDPMFPVSCSADGHYLVGESFNGKTSYDVWIMSLEGDRKPTYFLQTEFNERGPVVSHDSRWIAYYSDESGKEEIYIRPFPSGNGKWQVSTKGGWSPKWRRDGKELYYNTTDGTIMSVKIESSGSMIVAGQPTPVFNIPRSSAPELYDVTNDGQRFLIGIIPGGVISPVLTLVTGWQEKVKKQ